MSCQGIEIVVVGQYENVEQYGVMTRLVRPLDKPV